MNVLYNCPKFVLSRSAKKRKSNFILLCIDTEQTVNLRWIKQCKVLVKSIKQIVKFVNQARFWVLGSPILRIIVSVANWDHHQNSGIVNQLLIEQEGKEISSNFNQLLTEGKALRRRAEFVSQPRERAVLTAPFVRMSWSKSVVK